MALTTGRSLIPSFKVNILQSKLVLGAGLLAVELIFRLDTEKNSLDWKILPVFLYTTSSKG
jgi:hypothetical protein